MGRGEAENEEKFRR